MFYFESENELKFYNLAMRIKCLAQRHRNILMWDWKPPFHHDHGTLPTASVKVLSIIPEFHGKLASKY